MKIKHKIVRVSLFVLAAILVAAGLSFSIQKDTNAASGTYKILAWNDLGMHCYNQDFADLAVLPPYNNLWVQVVQAGDPPKLVTSGITVSYSYADNTYSVGKTNFWTYAKALFGATLPPNVGLKGKGLSGAMDLSGDHYVAEGIPLTEFSDSAPTVRQPYQLATVVVKDSATGAVLATQSVVTPTSSEMRCDKCHSDTGIAAPDHKTGKVTTNILQKHDEDSGTNLMGSRPVLCASCHSSNALGAPGKPGIPSLSNAMHEQHAEVIPNTLDGCYNCHPGPQTRCLRDVMSQTKGMTCINCHGTMAKVASNPNPWLNEPRCDTCHNTGQFNQNKALYRLSTEHGGLYCEACHDSTHAIAPSREANDAIKFIALQGKNGPLSDCRVCHVTPPAGNLGPHGTSFGTPTYTISGNAGVAGATLTYVDGSSKTATADSNGIYSISIPSGWSGTITPSKTGYSFTPPNRTYTTVTASQANQDYTAKPVTYTISGNAGVAGASLAYTDGVAKTATADSNGIYSISIPSGWSGTITPSKTGYSFTPPNRTYTSVTASQANQNYTAKPTPQVLTKITVMPASVTLQKGKTQQFSATAYDQFNHLMSPQPAFSWQVSGGGSINSTGLFTAGPTAGGPFTVTAKSGSVSGTAKVTVAGGGDFSIKSSPSSLNVRPGQTAVYTITITPLNGFIGSVTLSLSGQPAGAIVKFTPNPAGVSSKLTVQIPYNVTRKTYSLTIKGISGGLSHTFLVTLAVPY